jgi:DNA-binding CsgD family transcriptional regulator
MGVASNRVPESTSSTTSCLPPAPAVGGLAYRQRVDEMAPRQLVGRAAERADIELLLDAVRGGLGASLVVRGEAGIGKTALLDATVVAAADLRVLRLVGIESEMELGYAGLHQLVHPFVDELEILPTRQRDALRVAFGFEETARVDRMMVGLATLTLLSTVASQQALLCVIDDAQWLDRESTDVLAFVARRLLAYRVGLIIAVRDPDGDHLSYRGVSEVRLAGLAEPDAAQLLATVAAGPVQPEVARQVATATGGNPLAVRELATRLTPLQLLGQAPLPHPLPVGRQIEEQFHGQVQALPEDTRTFLLTAAADPTGDTALVLRAGRTLGFDRGAASPAEEADLLVVEPRISFRHPLIRSAVYDLVDDFARRRVHRALAEATDAEADPDRRAWHRAVAVSGVDEDIARDLERAADRARRRGGCATAAAFLIRAAQLSDDAATRTSRLLAAAEEEIAAGDPAHAQVLVAEAQSDLTSPLDLARARAIQGVALTWLGQAARVPAALLEAAEAFRPYDLAAARGIVFDAMPAALQAGRYAIDADITAVARAALAMPLPPDAVPGVDDLLLDGIARWNVGQYSVAAPLLRRALAMLTTAPAEASLRSLDFGCWATLYLGDIERAADLSRTLEAAARDQGAWSNVGSALHYREIVDLARGAIAAAGAHVAEERAVESTRSESNVHPGIALALAWSGRESELRDQVALTRRDAPGMSRGWTLTSTEYAAAVLELGLGNYTEARLSFPPDWEQHGNLAAFGAADYVEAAARGGDIEAAVSAMKRFEARALAANTPALLGLLARCRALVAAGDHVEALYLDSIARLEAATAEAEVARSRLLYGEWLRRANRALDAREQLRLALDTFEAIGAGCFAERARAELLVAGGRAGRRDRPSPTELTPREAQVAQMAAEGATNVEIAGRLFVSPNTVDYHLRKVYRKLGITSRRQLRSSGFADAVV